MSAWGEDRQAEREGKSKDKGLKDGVWPGCLSLGCARDNVKKKKMAKEVGKGSD